MPPRRPGSLPSTQELITWPIRLAGEVVRLPETMGALRRLTSELAETLHHVNTASDRVITTTEPLNRALNSTLEHIVRVDRAVTDLHRVFFNVVERLPGAKRALRGTFGTDAEMEAELRAALEAEERGSNEGT